MILKYSFSWNWLLQNGHFYSLYLSRQWKAFQVWDTFLWNMLQFYWLCRACVIRHRKAVPANRDGANWQEVGKCDRWRLSTWRTRRRMQGTAGLPGLPHSMTGKIMEQIILSAIRWHMQNNERIRPSQQGFVKDRSFLINPACGWGKGCGCGLPGLWHSFP